MTTNFAALACALLLFAGSAIAAPVTYDLIATPSATGNVSGFITWDSGLAPGINNSNLTLANALDWQLSYAGTALPGFSFTKTGLSAFIIDDPVLSGAFGATDLHVLVGTNYSIIGTGNPSQLILYAPTGIFGDPAPGEWIAFNGSTDGGRGWHLRLRSVPEPGTLLLTCFAMGAVLVRNRRKRQV